MSAFSAVADSSTLSTSFPEGAAQRRHAPPRRQLSRAHSLHGAVKRTSSALQFLQTLALRPDEVFEGNDGEELHQQPEHLVAPKEESTDLGEVRASYAAGDLSCRRRLRSNRHSARCWIVHLPTSVSASHSF
jgi:hypothetical protein